MICPKCGARMADGTSICPICGSDMGVTNKIPRMRGVWCSSCGALIPEGSDACPKCGMPSPNAKTVRPVRDIKLPKVSDADKTAQFSAVSLPEPEIEDRVYEAVSAIPPERPAHEERTLGYDRMAHVRVMVIAAIAALFVFGGMVLLITHPFSPNRNDPRAREEADTSTVGSPGQLESLSGQDVRTTSASADEAASEATFELLYSVYTDLADIAVSVDEQEAYFLENYLVEDRGVRTEGLDACNALYDMLLENITALEQLGSSSIYAEDISNVIQLGRWQLYRVEVLIDAWNVDLGYLAPAMVQDIIDERYYSDKDDDGVSMNKKYFDVCYEDWEPKKR